MNISATELNKNPCKVIDQALRKPIIINKQGGSTVVLVDYEYFTKLEDNYWGKSATNIAKQPEWLSAKESENFLKANKRDSFRKESNKNIKTLPRKTPTSN